MRRNWTTIGSGILVILLALAPRQAGAQANPFDRYDVPAFVQNFTGGTVRTLDYEFQADIYVLGAFDGKRRVDRFEQREEERAQPWRIYGRLGPMHFQNQLEPRPQGLQFAFRRMGPSLTGRVYIGVFRTFD